MKSIRFIFASVLFVLATGELKAAGPTTVRDSIAVSTTWTKDNSPYIIQNDIKIAKGAVLTIEPGTQVQLTSPTEGKVGTSPNLVVEGGLKAVGNVTDHISFGPSATGSLWGAIYFNGSDNANSTLQWCMVKGGRIVCNNASPVISQCAIYGAKSGVEIAVNSQPQITSSRITADGIGIVLLSDSASPIITNNDIYNNTYGFYLKYFGTPDISGNRVYNNIKYNVVNYSAKSVTMANNDFRQVDARLIMKTIYDRLFNPQFGKVEFTPFVGMEQGQTQAALPQTLVATQEKPQIQEGDMWSYGRPFDAMKISKLEDQKKNSSGLVKAAAVGATAVVTVVLLFF